MLKKRNENEKIMRYAHGVWKENVKFSPSA